MAFYKNIEELAKNLYEGEATSKSKGVEYKSTVKSIKIVEDNEKYQKYLVIANVTTRFGTTEKSCVFTIPQFKTTNIKQTSINISMVNPCIRFYKNNSGIVVGASFKGIYISGSRNLVKVGSESYSLDEFEQALKLLRSGDEETLKSVMDGKKIEQIKNLKIHPLVINKLKLVLDMDEISDSILDTQSWTILKSIAKREIKTESVDVVTPYDIEYFDYNKGLLYQLNNSYFGMKKNFLALLSQHGGIYASTIETVVKSFLLGNRAIINMVQYTQDTNPLSFYSQSKKMYFLDYKTLKKVRINSPYMDGILDPIRTHENTVNVNVTQELSLACDFNQGDSKIKVYDKDFNEIYLSIDEYFNSKILSFECIDYKRNQVKKNRDGFYKYCKRVRYYSTENLDEIDYYRHEGSLLSSSSALMPMITRNDLTRDLLQSHYNTQWIPVKGSRKPIIYTSFNKEIYKDSHTNVKSSVSGVVVAISENGDEIKVQTGVENRKPVYEFISVNKYNRTKSHTANVYDSTVKVGDKISEGDVVFKMNSFKDGEMAIGVPLLTAYSTLRGFEDEDGYVMSESAVKKFARKDFITYTVNFIHGNYKLDQHFFASLGDEVDENSVLIKYTENKADPEAKSLLGNNLENWQDVEYKLPKFSVSGKVVDIKIKLNPNFLAMKDDADKANVVAITPWTQDAIAYKKKFYDNPLFADEFILNDATKDIDFIIEMTVEYYNSLKLTDKITNRSSNKGVLTHIIPDDQMPRTEDGRIIECMMPALAMPSRKNSFNITENKLTKLSQRLLEILNAGEFEKYKSVFEAVYPEYSSDGITEDKVRSQEDDGFLRIQIDPLDNFIPDEELDKLMESVGIPNGGKEYLIDGVTGKRIRNPIQVGYNEYSRTHFIAEYKGSATPEIAYTEKMVMGVGHNRHEGQKFGEQEVAALQASGKEDYLVAATFENNRKDIQINADLNNILMRISTVEVDE